MIKQFGILNNHPERPPAGSNTFHYYGLTDGRLFWQTPTAEIQLTATMEWVHDIFELTSTQVANRAVGLTNTPAIAESVILAIEGAPSQVQTRSYNLSGSTVSWAGTDLEGVVSVGDVFSIKYII